ncbi:AraC family transcriptional regulator [Paenibacillus sp. FSL W7-1279]|uniref:AraC family transcriptional regulator n=1 Tax=Paenibacillus sp. FSL W7-1279 TaxID=2921697 RepID=UPI0030D7E0D1
MMRKSWFKRLLLSYMPVFMIVITFIFFVFFQMFSEQSRREALNANKTLSLQAMRIVDTSLKVIDNMIVLESINSESLNNFFKANSGSDAYINIRAVQKLKELINYYPLIDSIYLVRYSDGYVLSDATNAYIGSYPDRKFIEEYQVSKTPKWTGGRSFEQFKMIGGKQVASLVRGSPYMKNNLGMIVVNVSADSLKKLTENMYESKVSFIQAKDASGQLLFGSEAKVKESELFSEYTSDYTGWKYGSGLINGGYVNTISELYNLWFVIGLLMIAAGFIWMIYVTRRNARPIERIAERFSDYSLPVRGAGLWKGSPDEFAFIESAFDHILEQSRQYQEKYQEDLHLRTRYLFHQLIEGQTDMSLEEWQEEAAILNLPEPLDRFRLLIIEMDNYGEFCRKYTASDQNLLKFVLRNVVNEIAMKESIRLWSEWTSPSCLAVIYFEGDETEEREGEALSRFGAKMRGWTEQNLKFTVTIGSGEEVYRIQDLSKSYKSAAQALKYKIVLGENRLIRSEDIAGTSHAEVYAHLGEISSIIQSYRMLNIGWEEAYEAWFGQLKGSLLTNEEIFNLMNYLLYNVGRELSDMNKDVYREWSQVQLPLLTEMLDHGSSLEQLRIEIKQVMTSLFESVGQLQEGRQYAALIREICKLIEQDYANPDLSLEMLGDRFQLNPKYISKLFKGHTGQRFVDFLIQVRMREAVKLLLETDASVQEIAERVGYTHAISLTRVFKRIMGTAPGEYRSNQLRKTNS